MVNCFCEFLFINSVVCEISVRANRNQMYITSMYKILYGVKVFQTTLWLSTGSICDVTLVVSCGFYFLWFYCLKDHVVIRRVLKLMKGKALKKHRLHEKTAASVLLKLFISGNEWCHTTDAPYRMSRTPFSNVINIHVHSMIPEDQKNMTTQWCSTGRLSDAIRI